MHTGGGMLVVTFWSDIDPTKFLTSAKGNLGRLATLQISSEWNAEDVFQDVPCLTCTVKTPPTLAIITDDELLCCLGVLLAPEQLTISESGLPNAHAVITDTFLQGLVCECNTSVFPRLRFLSVASHLRFTDTVFLDMVISRVEAIHNLYDADDVCFAISLWWWPRPERKISFEVMDELSEFVSGGILAFSSGADNFD
ncbi:hypothetical protein K438DRAFT_1758009 [Mycena galopus ATCC 62051]|nr:hypothetical protein K438DRAFT_1758009 [Mycena galopus ATCC 62051]